MDIRDFLVTVATDYDRTAGLRTHTQDLLRNSHEALGAHVPGGIQIRGSGGKGTATLTPWVGFFDPDETTSPEQGLYAVYLFAAELETVNLMLLQGITKLDRELGRRAARDHLAKEAEAIRRALPEGSMDGWAETVDLQSRGFRQLAYASACVAALTYSLGSLPPEQSLRIELLAMLSLYQDAIRAKRHVAVLRPETSTEAVADHEDRLRADPLAYFRPKDDSDYVAHLGARELVKSRRHEGLVREYGEWARARGFDPSTSEHPKDLVLRREVREWLVEAKVLYRGNATNAVRAALGQLLQYRYFLCRDVDSPKLVALFSEPIGDAFSEFLESLAIAAVWKEGGLWLGSKSARSDGIAETSGSTTENQATA